MSVTLDVDDEPIPGLDADGRPDPDYARRLGLVPAPAGRRSAAFALDATVWIVLALPGVIGAAILVPALVTSGASPAATPAGSSILPLVLIIVSQVLLTAFGLTQLILHGRRGVTLGKASFGIRSVNVATFGRPGFWRVTLRALVLWGSQAVLPLVGPAVMFASSSWDPGSRGRSWLDRIGRCYAVDARQWPRSLRREGAAPCAPWARRSTRRRARQAAVARERPSARRWTVHPVGALEFGCGLRGARGSGRLGPAGARAGRRGSHAERAAERPGVRARVRRRHARRGIRDRAARTQPRRRARRTRGAAPPARRRQHAHLEDARGVRRSTPRASGWQTDPRGTAPWCTVPTAMRTGCRPAFARPCPPARG